MATQKQIEANRRNALKSTGPRTAEGKARASRNHTIHGLFTQPRFPDVNDPDFVHRLQSSAATRWPRSPEEARILVNMTLGDWLQRQEMVLSTQVYGAYYRDAESPDPAVRERAMDDFSRGLKAVLRLGGRADRIANPAWTAWMRLLGADPATLAQWEAEQREDEEEMEDALGTGELEPLESPEQARQAEDEHERFVQLAIRTHFSPGSRPVVPTWDGTVHPEPPVP